MEQAYPSFSSKIKNKNKNFLPSTTRNAANVNPALKPGCSRERTKISIFVNILIIDDVLRDKPETLKLSEVFVSA